MNRRLSTLLAFLLLVTTPPLWAATFTVGTCGGNPGYTTVEDAIAAAKGQNSTGPHEVVICPGTYTLTATQILNWQATGMTIRSSTGNRADVTLKANGRLFETQTERITFADLTLESRDYETVRIVNWSSNITFRNVLLKGTKGITTGDVGPVTLTDSRIEASTNGIEAQKVGGLVMTNTQVIANTANWTALWITEIYGNFALTDVTMTAGTGISVGNGNGTTAKLRNIEINATYGRGITISNTILELTADPGRKNRITAVQEAIRMRDDVGPFVVEEALLSGQAGISIPNSSDNVWGAWRVKRTEITATQYGILGNGRSGGTNPVIEDVTITAGWFALNWLNGYNITIQTSGSTPNRFTSTSNHAIYVANGGGLTVRNSVIEGGKAGIYIANGWSDYTLTGNIIRTNEEGVYITSGADNGVITSNRFERAGGYGLYLGRNVLWGTARVAENCFFTANTAWNNYYNSRFDNGSRGNYWGSWSDGCADANNDGICDAAYSVPGPASARKYDTKPLKTCPPLPSTTALDHIQIEGDGSGLTCLPETITVKACANSSCTTLFPDPVTVTLTADNGATLTPASLTFTGQTTVTLRKTTPGLTTLAVTAATPAPTNATQCNWGSCTVNFADAGLIFTEVGSTSAVSIPTQLSGKRFSQTAGTDPNTDAPTRYALRAVRKDDHTGACQAAVAGPQSVTLTTRCVDPGSCTSPTRLEVNGTPVPNPLTLTFDANGTATLGELTYRDAGRIQLQASLTVNGVQLTGVTNEFVVMPVGFCVISDAPTCATPNASCPKGKKAGEYPVSITVTAKQWERVNDDDLCVGNDVTPNFPIALSSCPSASGSIELKAKWVGGGSGYQDTQFVDGSGKVESLYICSNSSNSGPSITFSAAVGDVGVFKFTATLEKYLDVAPDVVKKVTGTTKDSYGRFYAPRIRLSQKATLQPGWGVGGKFVYFGADTNGDSNVGVLALGEMEFEAGYSRAAYDGREATPEELVSSFQTVSNYHDDYAKINPIQMIRDSLYVDGTPWTTYDPNDQNDSEKHPKLKLAASNPAQNAAWNAGQLAFTEQTPLRFLFTRPEKPVAQSEALRLRIKESAFTNAVQSWNPDGSSLLPAEDVPCRPDDANCRRVYNINPSLLEPVDPPSQDAVVDNQGQLNPYTVRYGRLVLGDGNGSTGKIFAPLRVEYWRNGAWVVNGDHTGQRAFDPTAIDFISQLLPRSATAHFDSINVQGNNGEWTLTATVKANERTARFRVSLCLPLEGVSCRVDGPSGQGAPFPSHNVPTYLRTCHGSSGVPPYDPGACSDNVYNDDPRATWSYTPGQGGQERIIDRRERF
ncbi:DUF6701 domain-containing protein [Hydrogenophilus islandicus]